MCMVSWCNVMSERKLLMIPGPTNVDPAVLRALSKPQVSPSSPTFVQIQKEVIENLKKVFMTASDVFTIAGSSTLGMEAAVTNVIEPGDKVLVICNGFFSDRFAAILDRHGVIVERLNVEWGKAVDPQVIKEKLEHDNYKAVTMVHVETSTGATNQIREIGEVVKAFDTLFLIDAVSSLGGMEVRVDDWHIDICVSGSQKALASLIGLALLAVSPKAMQVVEKRKTPVAFYYGDFKNWLPMMRDPSKLFATPAVNLIYALQESLRIVIQEGLENRFRRHQIIADYVRTFIKALGLRLVADETHAADTVTAIYCPSGITDAVFRNTMETKFGVIVGGGLGQLAGRAFRIGHMGCVTANDVTATMAAVEGTLAELNYPFEYGAGAKAAQDILRSLK